MCVSRLHNGSDTEPARDKRGNHLGLSGQPSPTVSPKSEPDRAEAHDAGAPIQESRDQEEEVVVFETSLVPSVEVKMAQRLKPCSRALEETPEEGGSYPGVLECSGGIVESSSCCRSDGPRVVRCFQVACRPSPPDAHPVSSRPLNDCQGFCVCLLLCSTVESTKAVNL